MGFQLLLVFLKHQKKKCRALQLGSQLNQSEGRKIGKVDSTRIACAARKLLRFRTFKCRPSALQHLHLTIIAVNIFCVSPIHGTMMCECRHIHTCQAAGSIHNQRHLAANMRNLVFPHPKLVSRGCITEPEGEMIRRNRRHSVFRVNTAP